MNNNEKWYFKTVIVVLISLLLSFNVYAEANNQHDNKTQQFAAHHARRFHHRPPPVYPPHYSALETFNRHAFIFNDTIDTYILRPIATIYSKVIPYPIRLGVTNFYNNINMLPTIANDALQFHLFQMYKDIWRVIINTTAGVGGLIDVATYMNLPFYYNDFGMTLATWGYRDSTFVVLPLWGPGTFRDAIALPVDYYAFSVYPYIRSGAVVWGMYGLDIVNSRANKLKFQGVYEEVALDKYTFVRNAYLQRRSYLIDQNKHRSFQGQKALTLGQNNAEPSSNLNKPRSKAQ